MQPSTHVDRQSAHPIKRPTSLKEEGLIMTSKLKTVLLQRVEEDFQAECQVIIQRLDHYKTLLKTIADAGRFSLPTTIRGTDVHHPEYEKDLGLLERCGVVQSRVKSTKHNAYREYVLTEKGQALIREP